MPLQNRVQPDGDIVASTARGTMFGNRGGKFHNAETKTLHPRTRWSSKHWICCVLKFKNYSHPVMGERYTGLFFLDEVTALAAGHRPCFECRRADAVRFAEHWQRAHGLDERPMVSVMDTILHEQRLNGRSKKTISVRWADLPDGAVVSISDLVLVRHNSSARAWSLDGYQTAEKLADNQMVELLTPPATVDVLRAGYEPLWHPSIEVTV